MKFDKKKLLTIAVVAHDVGGTELLSSMVACERDNFNWSVITLKDSPANSIFIAKGLKHLSIEIGKDDNPDTVISEISPDYILTGTGSTEFEMSYVREARKKNICSITFLDHWVNYLERFKFPKKQWKDNIPNYKLVQ